MTRTTSRTRAQAQHLLHRRPRDRHPRRRDDLPRRAPPRHQAAAPVLLAEARLPAGRQLPRLHGRDRGRARAGGKLPPHADARHEGQDPDRPRQDRAPHGGRTAAHRPARDRGARTIRIPSSGRSSSARRSRPAASPSASRSRCPQPDRSHVAMAVNLDACIQCNLCVRACREVQVNDVIGMAGRGHLEKIVFDFDDPMGASTCVACGECVQACPTGALMPATMVDENNVYHRQARPHGRQRLPLLRRRLPAHLPDQGRQDRRRHRQERPGQPEPAVREGPLRLRLRRTIRSAC